MIVENPSRRRVDELKQTLYRIIDSDPAEPPTIRLNKEELRQMIGYINSDLGAARLLLPKIWNEAEPQEDRPIEIDDTMIEEYLRRRTYQGV